MIIKSINVQNMISFRDSYGFKKNLIGHEEPGVEFNSEKPFQDLLDCEKGMQDLRNKHDEKVEFKESTPLLKDESLFPSFLSNPVARGRVRQSMVIYNKDGEVRGCYDEENKIGSWCDYLVSDL